MPGMMKAATLRPGNDAMEIMETARPDPAKGEMLVQIKVAGINEMDVETRNGGWAKQVRHFRTLGPVITGFEFAGIAVSDGEDIKAGTPVFGYSPFSKARACMLSMLRSLKPAWHRCLITLASPTLQP